MQYIFLSHDVDWRKQGPMSEHILNRKDRFDPELFKKTPIEKMYYNFPEFMERDSFPSQCQRGRVTLQQAT